MEREVAAMATRLESSVGLETEDDCWDWDDMEFAEDLRDVKVKGGLVAIGAYRHRMEKTKDGKDTGDIELPKTKRGEAGSGSKTKRGEAKPAGGRKRTKIVKYRIDKSKKHLFTREPLRFNLSLPVEGSEAFAAALRRYHEMERNIVEQMETKGYAEYEREVTDDEEEPISV